MDHETVSLQALAQMGGGILAYVREIEADEARVLLGIKAQVPAKGKLFCLYNADGTPLSISGSREAAIGSALEHDLTPASVH
jgi:hypothetical protein